MEATSARNKDLENQSKEAVECPHDRLIYEEQYAGVAFMFDQMDKLVTTEHSL